MKSNAVDRRHGGAIKRRKTCAHPDCDIELRNDNKSGVCQGHLHMPPHCQCRACQIRGVNRDKKYYAQRMANDKCPVEGCGARLGRSWKNGVCSRHVGHPIYCQSDAAKAARARGPRVSERPDVRVIHVPVHTGTSTVDGYAPVSLKAEPWAMEGGM